MEDKAKKEEGIISNVNNPVQAKLLFRKVLEIYQKAMALDPKNMLIRQELEKLVKAE
jgi:hypothetical protein